MAFKEKERELQGTYRGPPWDVRRPFKGRTEALQGTYRGPSRDVRRGSMDFMYLINRSDSHGMGWVND